MRPATNPRIGAVVLAAGQSSRMGEAKQLLPLGGGTILEKTLATVAAAGLDETVLVLGASSETILRQLPTSLTTNVKVVLNREYATGMASSLREGLYALSLEIEAALVVLADQPFIRSETLRSIVRWYAQNDARIVVPMYQGVRGNPVLFDRALFPEVLELQGDIGFRAIFERHAQTIGRVEVEDPGVLLDIDDRSDYARMRALSVANFEDPNVKEPGVQ